jgi:hypothetical protein
VRAWEPVLARASAPVRAPEWAQESARESAPALASVQVKERDSVQVSARAQATESVLVSVQASEAARAQVPQSGRVHRHRRRRRSRPMSRPRSQSPRVCPCLFSLVTQRIRVRPGHAMARSRYACGMANWFWSMLILAALSGCANTSTQTARVLSACDLSETSYDCQVERYNKVNQ